MKWSQLRKQIESRFAETVAKRVALHTAHYRHAHDGDGRAWIEVDGQEVATMCYFQAGRARRELEEQLRVANNPENRGAAGLPCWIHDEAIAITQRAGIISQAEFYRLLESSLQSSIDVLLRSGSPIARGLAVLDARVGKRRLKVLAAHPDEHQLVRMLVALRCEAEGIDLPSYAA